MPFCCVLVTLKQVRLQEVTTFPVGMPAFLRKVKTIWRYKLGCKWIFLVHTHTRSRPFGNYLDPVSVKLVSQEAASTYRPEWRGLLKGKVGLVVSPVSDLLLLIADAGTWWRKYPTWSGALHVLTHSLNPLSSTRTWVTEMSMMRSPFISFQKVLLFAHYTAHSLYTIDSFLVYCTTQSFLTRRISTHLSERTRPPASQPSSCGYSGQSLATL